MRSQHYAISLETPKGNQLPPQVHAILTEEDIGEGRVIIVGDIHGCDRELHDLLSKCDYMDGKDTVLLVGDLVGKGPNSVQVLRDAQRFGYKAVRGNWEENALAAHEHVQTHGTEHEEKWKWLASINDQDLAFMNSMPFSMSIPSHGCIVVHAGLVPGIPLYKQDLFDLIEIRHVDLVDPNEAELPPGQPQEWEALPKFPRDAGKPWATVWPGPEHIIFGHHARRRLQECSFASGIDTGCCLGDQLTALVLPSLADLRARGWHIPTEGVTSQNLGAKLVSVQAAEKYVKDDKD